MLGLVFSGGWVDHLERGKRYLSHETRGRKRPARSQLAF